MKKIIVYEKNPTAACYYKVLRFLLEQATRKEIEGYLDELEKSFEQWKLLKILFILTIDFWNEMWYNWAARRRAHWAEFTIIPHPTQFCQELFCTNFFI